MQKASSIFQIEYQIIYNESFIFFTIKNYLKKIHRLKFRFHNSQVQL